MKDGFYRAFEERYRGSRDEIKRRLRVYLPFVESLVEHLPGGRAVDLGCGRGEWLELLADAGCDAVGVDLDEAMLAACRERGLSVRAGEALGFLKGLPDCSQMVVSGFHIAEHLSFPDLKDMIAEALRVLEPGGLLILETPNPENLSVGASGFYLDPTHQRPLPPGLLAFVPEYLGFKRVKVMRLQESPELVRNDAPNLFEVLAGVSPDYAVLAQKDGPPEILDAVRPLLGVECGLTLEALAARHEIQTETRIGAALARAARAETVATDAAALAGQAAARAEQAEAHAAQALARCDELLASSSWRYTAPLRAVAAGLRGLVRGSKRAARDVLQRAARAARAHPRLRRAASRVFVLFPTLRSRLVGLLSARGPEEREAAPSDLAQLSRGAREFYADLSRAVDPRSKGSDV